MICLKVSLSTRCLVVAIEHVCTTSLHPDPPGYAPSSDPLSPSSPPVGTGRRGDSQKRKFLYAPVIDRNPHPTGRHLPIDEIEGPRRQRSSAPDEAHDV